MPLFVRVQEDGACWVSNGATRSHIGSIDDLTEAMSAYPGAVLRQIPRARLGAYGVDVGGIDDHTFTLSVEQLAQLEIGPDELTAIKRSAAEGVMAVVPSIVDAIVARLPAETMTWEEVEHAVREALAGGPAPFPSPI